ncbi:HXXEE domain-containing protein [Actinomyces sp. 2119]|uniref:HXXEE domain-containing protein n=1 Tax=Actinomyces sp. 2119 TaxID=2321393 RepID=UPI001602BB62|nr:HXXEE domain-containing protein [Actinomyces sp. 2119]
MIPTDDYSLFMHSWPWMGLGAGIVLTAIAFTTNLFRSDTTRSRWKDPVFIAWLGAIEYMVHNFEEYGVSVTGEPFAFVHLMERAGMDGVTEGAYLGCNITLVWLVGPALAVLSRRRPALCGAMPLFAAVNGLSHLAYVPSLGYNAGLATSLLLFIPLGAYTTVTFYGRNKPFNWRTYFRTAAVAALYTGCVFFTVRLASSGTLSSSPVLTAFITCATIVCGGLWWLAAHEEVHGAIPKTPSAA